MVSRNKNKTHKRPKSNRTKGKRNINYELHYFRMDGCKWCDDFQNTLLPKLLKKKNLTTKIFNNQENPELVQKYKIQTYPALVRVRGKRHKLFKDKRNKTNILKFLR
jgi:hypothetical protein